MASAPFKNAALLTPEQLQSRLGEFYKSVEEFNDGYYFESHETLEDLWMVTPLPERDFFQAIIQLAAAFVHFSRGEYPGILKLLDAASSKLGVFTPTTLGVDVAASVSHLHAIQGPGLITGTVDRDVVAPGPLACPDERQPVRE